MLTRRQREVLDAIITFTQENNYSPTVREIGSMIGSKSPSTVQVLLKKLKRKGFVTWEPKIPRTIRIIKRIERRVKHGTRGKEPDYRVC